jgi:heme exporter protein D
VSSALCVLPPYLRLSLFYCIPFLAFLSTLRPVALLLTQPVRVLETLKKTNKQKKTRRERHTYVSVYEELFMYTKPIIFVVEDVGTILSTHVLQKHKREKEKQKENRYQ